MAADLAATVREAATKQGLSLNQFIIALVREAVHDGRAFRPDPRIHVRQTLRAALARLDDEEAPAV